MNVVISQSMYFPWVGLLEQVRLADVFVHYDDVQYVKGFTNRVQVKRQSGGTAWMSVPLRDFSRGQRIDEVQTLPLSDWMPRHLSQLQASFGDAPHALEALALARDAMLQPHRGIADLARNSLLAVVEFLGLKSATRFVHSADLGILGSSSQRLLDIVKALGGTRYITGHGALRYLDHALFEDAGIEVAYMDYRCLPYPQAHGPFTPYVTGLDLIAHLGTSGVDHIVSKAVDWKEFTNGPERKLPPGSQEQHCGPGARPGSSSLFTCLDP